MTDSQWSKVQGMVISPALEPMKLAEYLRDNAIVAQIEWMDQSPHLVGMKIATDGQHVATLKKRAKHIQPGPSVEEFASALAQVMQAEVMVDDMTFDSLPEGAAEAIAVVPTVDREEALRVVEIGRTPTSAIPLLAAFEGVDIAEIARPDGKTVLAGQLPTHRTGPHFGEPPHITLSMHGDEFQATFIPAEDPESHINYNWAMNEVTIAGAQGWKNVTSMEIHGLVGALPDIKAIHDEIPGVDLEGAFRASQMRGPQAVAAFVTALGLPIDVTEYLLGLKSLSQMDSAVVHHARGISNAIGRSVDFLLEEKGQGSPFWDGYTNLVSTRPWLVPVATAVEAATGVGLLIVGRSRDGHRSGLAKLATGAGVMMLFDSVAENLLAKYATRRRQRHQERTGV